MNAWVKNVVRLAVSLWFLALLEPFGLPVNAQTFSGWSTPVNLGSTINTSFFELTFYHKDWSQSFTSHRIA